MEELTKRILLLEQKTTLMQKEIDLLEHMHQNDVKALSSLYEICKGIVGIIGGSFEEGKAE